MLCLVIQGLFHMRMSETLKLTVNDAETEPHLWQLNEKLNEHDTLLLEDSTEKCKETLTAMFCLNKACTCLTQVKLQYQQFSSL